MRTAVTLAAIVVAVVVGWIGLRTWYVDTHCTTVLGTLVCESSNQQSQPAPSQPQPTRSADPAYTWPAGVVTGTDGTFVINCKIAQCVIPGAPGAGPDDTTCQFINGSHKRQLCQ